MDECILCGHDSFDCTDYPNQNDDNKALSFDKIINCKNCGVGRALPLPTQKDLDEYYEAGDYWRPKEGDLVAIVHQKVQADYRFKKCISWINKSSNIKILDVGAGYGFIQSWLEKYLYNSSCNLEYHFIELDNAKINSILTSSKNIKCVQKSYDNLEEYDFIFLNHIIEHVVDPIVFLKPLINKIKPGGGCYIEVPNRDDGIKDCVFPHTLFFTPKSFEYLGSQLGLKQCQIGQFGSKRYTIISNPSVINKKPLGDKIKTRLYYYSCRLGVYWLQRFFANWIFRYTKKADGLWVYGIFQKEFIKE